MAYNRANFLKRVEEVQQIYLEHKEEGITTRYIYAKYIRKQYHISIRTFYDWLAVGVRRERREMLEKNPQLELFA